MQNLGVHGIEAKGKIYWDAPIALLYEHSILQGTAVLSHQGPLVVDTTPYTGRSPKDKFVVQEDESQGVWWGEVNQPFDPGAFDALYKRVTAHLSEQPQLYVQDLYAGAEHGHTLPVRVVTEVPWASLFARNMFILPRHLKRETDEIEPFMPGFAVIHAPLFRANPERDGTRSEVFVILSFSKKIILIGGTAYLGEIKKSIFTVMNFLMPKQDVLPMHCSANIGHDGRSAIFFGLSGTGKTTLSTDPDRPLIGDDEHGWGKHGVFNFEGGCYAKIIRLSKDNEPLIWEATNSFETILENAVINIDSRRIEFDDDSKTENTRSSYPLTHLKGALSSGIGPHPSNIFFLSADAFGVLPPIARLTPEQAMYYFISGYTAKVAGTERGVNEPTATFSACFGSPFLPLAPAQYAAMLGEKIKALRPTVWMINTGWTAGPHGVGERIALKYTRAMLSAALNGELDKVTFKEDEVFSLQVPSEVPGVPSEVLMPKNTWADPTAYDKTALKLADMFRSNFKKHAKGVAKEVLGAGPRA